MTNKNLPVAEALYDAGLTLILCKPDGQPYWGFKKSPHTRLGVLNALQRNPSLRIAIDLTRSGLEAIDLDRNHVDEETGECHDGIAELNKLVNQHGWPDFAYPMFKTPRGGTHIIGRAPADETRRLRNTAGVVAPGVDTRGVNGFVFTGYRQDGAYTLIDGTPGLIEAYRTNAIPELPAWVFELTKRDFEFTTPSVTQADVSDARGRQWALAALDGIASDLSHAVVGHRNNALNAAAFRAGRIAARGWISESETHGALWQACVANGYLRDDGASAFRATFRNAFRDGLRNPHPGPKDRPLEPVASDFTIGLPTYEQITNSRR
jgi:hypothetical protein